jgi:hypothetical protein
MNRMDTRLRPSPARASSRALLLLAAAAGATAILTGTRTGLRGQAAPGPP